MYMDKGKFRRNYFIDKEFQTKFILKFCLIAILSSLVLSFFVIFLSRGSTTVTIENARVMVKGSADFIFPIMLQTLLIATVFSAFAVSVLTLFVSHKIAGPLYRIKKEIDVLKSGDLTPSFKIRKDDQLQNLAVTLAELAGRLRDKHKALKERLLQLRDMLRQPQYNKEAVENKLKELEDILNYFKS